MKNAEAAFTKAKEQYEIQVIQNESDIAQAILALELAELDLAKYVGDAEAGRAAGEWFNELASAQETVLLRQEDLARARSRPSMRAIELEREEFLSSSQLETDQLAKKRAQIQLEQAERDLALKLKYGNRRRLAELSADVATKRRDVDKTRKQAAARLTDFEAARDSASTSSSASATQLAELRSQVSKSKIFAPEAGLMVYARERSRWERGRHRGGRRGPRAPGHRHDPAGRRDDREGEHPRDEAEEDPGGPALPRDRRRLPWSHLRGTR